MQIYFLMFNFVKYQQQWKVGKRKNITITGSQFTFQYLPREWMMANIVELVAFKFKSYFYLTQ